MPTPAAAARSSSRAHIGESERLGVAATLREQQELEASGVARALRRSGLLRAAADDPENKRFLAELREASQEREKERAAKAKVRELGEKRRSKPDARAASIAAAVLSDSTLYELLTRRLRETDAVDETGKRVMSAEPVFEVEDVAVLAVVLDLLNQRNPVVIGANHGGTWPRWSDLPPIPGLLERVSHLARNGWLAVSSESGGRSVTYGPESMRAAREAGVEVKAA